jgi:hypothetical protein
VAIGLQAGRLVELIKRVSAPIMWAAIAPYRLKVMAGPIQSAQGRNYFGNTA